MRAFITRLFSKRARVQHQAARGYAAALTLLHSSPTAIELRRAWSDACACEAFDSDASRAYDRGFKEVLRPLREDGMF